MLPTLESSLNPCSGKTFVIHSLYLFGISQKTLRLSAVQRLLYPFLWLIACAHFSDIFSIVAEPYGISCHGYLQ
jgi:hypothetical protein